MIWNFQSVFCKIVKLVLLSDLNCSAPSILNWVRGLMGFYLTVETITTRNRLRVESLERGFLVCKICCFVLGLFVLFWVGLVGFCIFNVVCIPSRLNQPLSAFSMNCRFPLFYPLLFLSTDVPALKWGTWSVTQHTIAEFL